MIEARPAAWPRGGRRSSKGSLGAWNTRNAEVGSKTCTRFRRSISAAASPECSGAAARGKSRRNGWSCLYAGSWPFMFARAATQPISLRRGCAFVRNSSRPYRSLGSRHWRDRGSSQRPHGCRFPDRTLSPAEAPRAHPSPRLGFVQPRPMPIPPSPMRFASRAIGGARRCRETRRSVAPRAQRLRRCCGPARPSRVMADAAEIDPALDR